MKNLAFAIASLFTLAISACGGQTRTTPHQTPSHTAGACTSSTDCPSGQTCDAGECTPNSGSTCATAMDCPENQYCQAGKCVGGGNGNDPASNCTSDKDCTGTQKCSSFSTCVDCTVDTDCSNGQTCSTSFTCSSGSCSSDTDCSNGTHCKSATSTCVQCVTDSDCAARSRLRSAAAKVCRNDMCTDPNAGCTNNNDCNGYVCNASTSTCVHCTSSGDCSTGQTCNTTTGMCSGTGTTTCSSSADCGGQACANGICQRCTSDQQCISGSGSGICNAQTGACGTPECSSASQCPAGEACYQPGHCGPCIADSECRTGEMCKIVPPDTTGWCYASTNTGSCTSNAQCPADLVCYQGVCNSCLSKSECDSGEYCSWNGRCITDTDSGGSTGSGACSTNTQCPWGYSCVSGYCSVNAGGGTGTGAFGSKCTNSQQCAVGLSCAGFSDDNSICTAPCVGDGRGGSDDCPSGYACYDFESTTLDGLRLCFAASQLSGFPGYPFSSRPGATCNGSNPSVNTCQTGSCLGAGGTCSRLCEANRDCAAGEVCYAWPTTSGYVHECYPSDTASYVADGGQCSTNTDCDSGICLGNCYNGDPCSTATDCSDGRGCTGTCVSHCRSSSDCDSNTSCNFWPMQTSSYIGWTPVCSGRRYNGTGGLGTTCSSDADCYSEWCMNGKCTTPCGTSSDCTSISNTTCTQVNFYNGNTPVYSGSFCLQ